MGVWVGKSCALMAWSGLFHFLYASSTRRNAALMFDQVKDLFETYPLLGLVVMGLITGVNILALILLDRKALRRAERECRELERLLYS
jgi:hypothetical protein